MKTPVGIEGAAEETPSLTGKFVGETHRGLEAYTSPPTWESAPEGLVEFGGKLDEKMKAMLRETKENVHRTNSDGKETGTQIKVVDQKEERNLPPEKNEETRIQKNEERLRNLQDIFKRSNI